MPLTNAEAPQGDAGGSKAHKGGEAGGNGDGAKKKEKGGEGDGDKDGEGGKGGGGGGAAGKKKMSKADKAAQDSTRWVYYTTPTCKYAGRERFAPTHPFKSYDGVEMEAQMILQCKAHPSSYVPVPDTHLYSTLRGQVAAAEASLADGAPDATQEKVDLAMEKVPEICSIVSNDVIARRHRILPAVIPFGLLVRVFPVGTQPPDF